MSRPSPLPPPVTTAAAGGAHPVRRERVPEGSVLSDADLRAMNWYVQGVVIDR